MTRAILALALLAGCSATPPPDSAIPLPDWELVTDADGAAVFDWCSEAREMQCAVVRKGDEMGLLQAGGRIGSGGDVWDVRGKSLHGRSNARAAVAGLQTEA